MSTTQQRKPAGTRAGGQWAPSQHDEPEVQITRSPVQDAATALAKRFGSPPALAGSLDDQAGPVFPDP
jgi:hypothetical protein